MQYWLMKSEPDKYSWQDLVRDGRTRWDGIRNHQVAIYLRSMQVGDLGLASISSLAKPCLVAFFRLWDFPKGVDGPVLRFALAWLARIRASPAGITAFLPDGGCVGQGFRPLSLHSGKRAAFEQRFLEVFAEG